jgi:hypothetical protein
MKTRTLVTTAAGLLLAGLGQAQAGLVYDNGPINGTINAWTINEGQSVSDSFTVSSPTALTSAQAGLWTDPGQTPTSVQWSIGTTPFGSQVSSGNASLNNTFIGNSVYGYPIYESAFAVSGLLSAGTYYFTLQNAVAPPPYPGAATWVAWDENDGPSGASAYTSFPRLGLILVSVGSESFQLYGTSAVPEPTTTIAGVGALALVLMALGARSRRSNLASIGK